MDLSRYRPNVGIVLLNAEGLAWMGRRTDGSAPFSWQFPQGGVDEGEDLRAAAERELAEETGVTSIEYLARTQDWFAYDFPSGYAGSKAARGWAGQKQIWFAFRFVGQDSEIRLDAHHQIEFDAWRWSALAKAPADIVAFKRASYEAVAEAFKDFARKA